MLHPTPGVTDSDSLSKMISEGETETLGWFGMGGRGSLRLKNQGVGMSPNLDIVDRGGSKGSGLTSGDDQNTGAAPGGPQLEGNVPPACRLCPCPPSVSWKGHSRCSGSL